MRTALLFAYIVTRTLSVQLAILQPTEYLTLKEHVSAIRGIS